ncbi:MAG: hypothetical protein N838_29485 [Thiohalocapsa sp. PB-PSB1]|nr:MAG: hypothetical protein N838_29485 [Thiohalocapsa sp. PB-PSB1]
MLTHSSLIDIDDLVPEYRPNSVIEHPIMRPCANESARPRAGLIATAVLITFVGAASAESSDGDVTPTDAFATSLPIGAIIAFMPAMGADYRNMTELRVWLKQQGWAICDGTNGTPNLRDRLLIGTTDSAAAGQRLGSWEHEHRIRGETDIPVRRNRNTPTGRLQSRQIPDDQHRHRVDIKSDRADHLPPSTRVLFIMKVR